MIGKVLGRVASGGLPALPMLVLTILIAIGIFAVYIRSGYFTCWTMAYSMLAVPFVVITVLVLAAILWIHWSRRDAARRPRFSAFRRVTLPQIRSPSFPEPRSPSSSRPRCRVVGLFVAGGNNMVLTRFRMSARCATTSTSNDRRALSSLYSHVPDDPR